MSTVGKTPIRRKRINKMAPRIETINTIGSASRRIGPRMRMIGVKKISGSTAKSSIGRTTIKGMMIARNIARRKGNRKIRDMINNRSIACTIKKGHKNKKNGMPTKKRKGNKMQNTNIACSMRIGARSNSTGIPTNRRNGIRMKTTKKPCKNKIGSIARKKSPPKIRRNGNDRIKIRRTNGDRKSNNGNPKKKRNGPKASSRGILVNGVGPYRNIDLSRRISRRVKATRSMPLSRRMKRRAKANRTILVIMRRNLNMAGRDNMKPINGRNGAPMIMSGTRGPNNSRKGKTIRTRKATGKRRMRNIGTTTMMIGAMIRSAGSRMGRKLEWTSPSDREFKPLLIRVKAKAIAGMRCVKIFTDSLCRYVKLFKLSHIELETGRNPCSM